MKLTLKKFSYQKEREEGRKSERERDLKGEKRERERED